MPYFKKINFKEMKNYIIKKLFKKQVDELILISQELNERERKLDEREIKNNNLIKSIKEKYDIEKLKISKEIKNSYDEKYKDEFINKVKTLNNFIDLKLLPGNNVWTSDNFSNDIKKVKINNIIIKEGNEIIINSDLVNGAFFKSKKEAVNYHNKKLENLKIK